MRRALTTLLLSAFTLALLAPVALADGNNNDHGQGWWGETNDLVVTYAGFILIAFFPLFALCATLVQSRLDKRKDARKAAEKARLARADKRGGW